MESWGKIGLEMRVGDIIIHLRFPFSFFLLPIWLLGVLVADAGMDSAAILSGIALHLFLYPASNAFNSYWDRDEGPIGGIKNPPKVDKKLLWVSLVWELPGLVLLWVLGPLPGLLGLVYSLLSKAYSWDRLRWKRFPYFSLGGIALVQGSLIILLCNSAALLGTPSLAVLAAVFAAAIFLIAVYPLTQIYQHQADAARGDRTYSMAVGIRGTFLHSGLFFMHSFAAFAWVFLELSPVLALSRLLILLACMGPALVFFLRWAHRCWKDSSKANFKNTMLMNILASVGMNLFLIICHLQLLLI